MRKIISVLLAAMLILSIAACGKQTGAQSSVKENTQSAEQETQPEITNSSTKPASEMNDDSTTEQADPSNEQEEEKVLVIYFSSANTVDADAISGATPRVDGLGVTE
ncbi:MAG: hypothetical protein IJ751_10240, partial [Oscillospiraceae bacterium]|nr:hypothetical protein [Oscillospiraceae bacterium]